MKKLLWVLPKWPLPATDGSRVATCSLISEITRTGVAVDLLVYPGSDEVCDLPLARKELGVRNQFILRRSATARSIFSQAFGAALSLIRNPQLPVTMRYYREASLPKITQSIISGTVPQSPFLETAITSSSFSWDALVYEGPHGAATSAACGRFQKPENFQGAIVYRAQNVESDIWIRKAGDTQNIILRSFIASQSRQMNAFEISLLRASDCLAAISPTDLERFREIGWSGHGAVVPVGYSFDRPLAPPDHNEKVSLLFLGRLDWPPNTDGLLWFLKHVWPKVISVREDLQLVIAGSGNPDAVLDALPLPRVHFLGKIVSVEEVYKNCIASLVPIFYGSGTRVKAIESARYGRACLSTAQGIEGLGLVDDESVLLAEDESEWIERLVALDTETCTRIGNNAFSRLQEEFDAKTAARKFLDLLKESQK